MLHPYLVEELVRAREADLVRGAAGVRRLPARRRGSPAEWAILKDPGIGWRGLLASVRSATRARRRSAVAAYRGGC